MNKEQRNVKIYSEERIDDLHRNGYKIIQNPKKFCFGMDAVLLSGFAKVLPGEHLVDLGTGTGIIPILLEAKSKGELFTGLEIQEKSADMARRSISLNNIDDKVKIIIGDIKESSNIFKKNSIDVVTSNPPYMTAKHGLTNNDESKSIARHEILCTLRDLIRETSLILKPGGRFYIVHRPFRLVEILNTLSEYKLEPKRMRMVHPFIDKEPNMVLIECIKGGKSMLKVEAPLVVYKEINVYTDEIYNIYGE